MKPGRELDELIAIKVMGWKVSDSDPFLWQINENETRHKNQFKPSTKPEDAEEVVWKVFNLGHSWILGRNRTDGKFSAYLDFPEDPDWTKVGDTEPHAICITALKAVGYEVKE